MNKIYIFGHQKPDTDSVTAAITLSYLKNAQGMNTEPRCLGDINEETKFVLNKFKVKAPKYINDVRLQLKDVSYHKGLFINQNATLKETYDYLVKKNVTGVPVVDNNKKLLGIVTLKDLAKEIISGDITKLNSSYDNILTILEGEEVVKATNKIEGNLFVVSYKSKTFVKSVDLKEDDILIVGDREHIHEYAVKSKVKLLIVTGNGTIEKNIIKTAIKNKVNIIRTKFDTFHTSRLITYSNNIGSIVSNESISFKEKEFYDDFVEEAKRLKHNNYPIVDSKNKCLGLMRITDINGKNSKKVILVDHQELEQSAFGIEEAEIIEIVDHHKIGNISTKTPINFRNMTVGSTNTIIYEMYKEAGVRIPKEIAGLMISGILSDTLILQSPTTTDIDRRVVADLANILKIDYIKYAIAMFKAGTSLKGKTKEEIINTDLKVFTAGDDLFAVSQIFTLDIDDIKEELDEYIIELEKTNNQMKNRFTILAVTDVLKNGSYIIYAGDCKDILSDGFNIPDFKQMTYIDKLVSRKKQIVPVLLSELE